VVEVLRVREAVGTVLARRGASRSSKPSFAVVERVVRLVTVLAKIRVRMCTFGDTDGRERGAGTDDFVGITLILAFSPPRVSISTL
jgi:hypothetical protein